MGIPASEIGHQGFDIFFLQFPHPGGIGLLRHQNRGIL